MSSEFKCFVEICDQKYDIVINEDISSVYFTDIYEKIQQILRLTANEDISYDTHVFQIIDSKSKKASIVDSFDLFVKHESVIRIDRKPQQLIDSYQYYQYVNTYDTYSSAPEVAPNQSANPKESYIPHEYYCDVCSVSVDLSTDPRLQKYRLNLNFNSYKRYSDLLETIKSMANMKCDSISEYEWLNVVPFKLRAFGYKDLSNKLWKNCFQLFRNKYIEAMEVSPNACTACSLFPFFHEYNSFEFDSTKDYYKKIKDLRDKMKTNLHSIDILSKPLATTVSAPAVDTIIAQLSRKSNFISHKKSDHFKAIERKLKFNEKDVKAFHLIIQMMNIYGKSYGKKSKHKVWDEVSDKMIGFGYDKREYNGSQCSQKFFIWAQYYAQIFDEVLKSKFDKDLQEIYDLFKIIHTLDLSKIYKQSNQTHKKLIKIRETKEIKDYLLTIRLNSEKLDELNAKNELNFDKSNENICETNIRITSNTVSQSDSCFTPIAMDLEDGEVCEELVNDVKPIVNEIRINESNSKTVKTCRTSHQTITSSQTSIPSTQTSILPTQAAVPIRDPRLKRKLEQQIKEVINLSSNKIRLINTNKKIKLEPIV